MHIGDSSDLIATAPTPREQAEKQMNQFTHWDDYDVYRIMGRKPKTEICEQPSLRPPKKRPGKKTEQTSLDFASAPAEQIPKDGDRA
jgi:hypothetical protein